MKLLDAWLDLRALILWKFQRRRVRKITDDSHPALHMDFKILQSDRYAERYRAWILEERMKVHVKYLGGSYVGTGHVGMGHSYLAPGHSYVVKLAPPLSPLESTLKELDL